MSQQFKPGIMRSMTCMLNQSCSGAVSVFILCDDITCTDIAKVQDVDDDMPNVAVIKL